MTYYHVRVYTKTPPRWEVKFDLSPEELEERILSPYRTFRPIVISGTTISIDNVDRIEITETPHPSSQFGELVTSLARQGALSWCHGERGAINVTDQFITTPSVTSIPEGGDAIELLCNRFPVVVSQLRDRHGDRPTLDVSDEYDVQDLMHALLRIFFEDVRVEEWTPSYAGGSSRMDVLLAVEGIVVETKKTRPGLAARQLGSELIDDIARYRAHPNCKQLVCFVYDPEGRIANPRGLERDLSRQEEGFTVKVVIAPRGYYIARSSIGLQPSAGARLGLTQGRIYEAPGRG